MVKFILKDKKSDKETPIRMHCYFYGVVVITYTGFKVHPDHWSKVKQQVTTDLKKVRTGGMVNQRLRELRTLAETTETSIRVTNPDINVNEFKSLFKSKLLDKGTKDIYKFVNYARKFKQMEEDKKGPMPNNTLDSALSVLKEFNPTYENLTFNHLTEAYLNKLIDFMLYERKNSPNYIANILGVIKFILTKAKKAGLHTNVSYLESHISRVEVDNIVLLAEEISQLKNVVLKNKYFEVARDIFLIQCHTGIRYSDAIKLIGENIYQLKYLRIRTRKTAAVVIIPIHPVVKEIIEKYNGFPDPVSLDCYNYRIKLVAKKAGLNREVTRNVNNEFGISVPTKVPIHKLISTHAGRRTALTNMLRAKISLYDIAKISGHKSIKQLQTYLKIDSEEVAYKLQDHVFFTGMDSTKSSLES